MTNRESQMANRESGMTNRESQMANRESGVTNRGSGVTACAFVRVMLYGKPKVDASEAATSPHYQPHNRSESP